jgi:hypothetical protein
MAEVVEGWSSKCEALSSNTSTAPPPKKKVKLKSYPSVPVSLQEETESSRMSCNDGDRDS